MQNHINAIIIAASILLSTIIMAIAVNVATPDQPAQQDSIRVVGEAQWQVDANTVVWPFSFKVGNNNLQNLHKSMSEQAEMISAFLLLNGVSKEEIELEHPQIVDRTTLIDASVGDGLARYIGSQTIVLTSQNLAATEAVMAKLPSLIAQGVLLNHSNKPQYLVGELNQLRAKMAIQARENAQQLATELANNAGATLSHLLRIKLGDLIVRSNGEHRPKSKLVTMTAEAEYFLTINRSKSQ